MLVKEAGRRHGEELRSGGRMEEVRVIRGVLAATEGGWGGLQRRRGCEGGRKSEHVRRESFWGSDGHARDTERARQTRVARGERREE